MFNIWFLCSLFANNVLRMKLPVRTPPMPYVPIASPTRPSFLPISEPIPVPTQREAFEKMYNQAEKKEESHSPAKVSKSYPYEFINLVVLGMNLNSLEGVANSSTRALGSPLHPTKNRNHTLNPDWYDSKLHPLLTTSVHRQKEDKLLRCLTN